MELGEAFLEGLVGQLVRRKLDEIHYLSCVCAAQSRNAVAKLCEAANKPSDSKLSFHLSKPYMCIVSPELRELEGYSMYTVLRMVPSSTLCSLNSVFWKFVHQNPFGDSLEYER